MYISNRKVFGYMVFGLLIAVLVGIVVWLSPSLTAGPGNEEADTDTSTSSSTSSSAPESTSSATSSVEAVSSSSSSTAPSPEPAPAPNGGYDPLAPPGAVVAPQQPPANGQQYYRPENVLPTTQPTGAPQPTDSPTQEPSAPSPNNNPGAPAPQTGGQVSPLEEEQPQI